MASLISFWQNWRDRRDVMRDIRRQKEDTREWAYFKFRDDMTDALSALEREDRARAAEIWTEALKKYPGQALESPMSLDVLVRLRRYDEAEALMNEGMTKKPGNQRFAIGLAEVARAKGDHEMAVKRWAMVRKRFPNAMPAYALGVEALRDLKRLPEAEALTKQTMQRFPEEVLGYMEHARLSDIQENWEQSLERWNTVRTRFNHLSGYTGVANAMIRLGRYDEADALLEDARISHPTDAGPTMGLAHSAQARGNIPEAIIRWKRLAQRFPLQIVHVFNAAAALEKLAAPSDAEEVLREAVDHFPDEPRPLQELGMFLLRQGNFTASAEAFAELRKFFPDNQAAYLQGAQALTQAGRPEEAEALREEFRKRFP